jgi:hypothetical protein
MTGFEEEEEGISSGEGHGQQHNLKQHVLLMCS